MDGKIEIIVCDGQEFDHALVEMYRQHDYNLKYPEWLEWKYRKNPYGEPILLIARFGNTIAGMQAHLPRDYHFRNVLIKTVDAVDAFIKPHFRRSGIYQRIWAEARRVIKDRELVLTTFPSVKSQSIGAMRNEGLNTLGVLNTYIKILRPAALLKGKRLQALGRIYEKVFNPFSRIRPIPSSVSVKIREATRFEQDLFTNQRAMIGGRSCNYLNWKFCDCPMHDYTCILFSETGQDIGFAVLRNDSEKFTVTIHDCVIERDVSKCIELLIRYILNNYPETGVISVTELEEGPLAPALKKNGLLSIPSTQVLMLDNIDESIIPLDPGQWLITRGDSDW